MIIAVASGKGGTGKTTVATSLALTLDSERDVLFLDCDVEAPNAHLFLKPEFDQSQPATSLIPRVDESVCKLCGTCAEVCQYNAITTLGQKVKVFSDLCHGCGSCMLNCPEGAISEIPQSLGVLESGYTKERIRFARGKLNIGQPMAASVIQQLKRAYPARPNETVILDASPGTTCPVVEAIREANYVLLVTEPTPFGLHDLKLAYELTRILNLPAGVIINRCGFGDDGVETFCAEVGLPVLMRIPFQRDIAAGIAQGIPLVTLMPEYKTLFQQVISTISDQPQEGV